MQVVIAALRHDFGPLSRVRVVAADIYFHPSMKYNFVVGDEDLLYNPNAVFDEFPDYLRRLQQIPKLQMRPLLWLDTLDCTGYLPEGKMGSLPDRHTAWQARILGAVGGP